MNGRIERSVWIVRHGMRADFADPQWAASAANPDDPPLDPIGITQANEAASRLERESIDHIFASPFLRTVQTADAIARRRGMQFNIERGLAEWFGPHDFKRKPQISEARELSLQFSSINPDYPSAVEPEYPESPDALDARTAAALAHILDTHAGSVLIISHASPIQSIQLALTGALPAAMQPMASVKRFDLVRDKWQVSIDNDSSHLTNPDTSGRVFRARPVYERGGR